MSKERGGYGFTNEDKKMVRDFAGGRSAFSDAPNNNVVHHITGCYVAKLDGIPKEVVSDPYLNAIMLTDEEAEEHDREEAYQVACLEYEKRGHTIYEGKEYGTRTQRNTHLRRRNKVLPRRNPHGRKGQLHWKRTTQSRRTTTLG